MERDRLKDDSQVSGANMWMMVIFNSRVSEYWKRGEERGDASVWDILNLKC